MNQQVYMQQQQQQQSNEVEQRQKPRQKESQHQNSCLELQQEIFNIRTETAKIKQEHLKLKKQIEERNSELQEYLRTQNVLNQNLLGMQVQNENTRVKIKNKEEALLKLMQKRSEVEEICTNIQDLCEPLSCVLIDVVQAKEEVTRYNNVTQENLEKLKEKFKHVSDKSELQRQNLNNIAVNEEQKIEKEKARKMREITLAKDNLHTLWNQLETLQKEANAKKEHITVTEKENMNRKNENEHMLDELKKQIKIEEDHCDSQTGIGSSLMKEVEEMEMNHKHIVEEISQWESEVLKLKSDSAELRPKLKTLNEQVVLKKKKYEEVQDNAQHMKAALEMCESELETVKLHSEQQDINLHTAKEELQNTVCQNNKMKKQIFKLQAELEEKVRLVEQQKCTAVTEIEELKATIKTMENELSNAITDMQRAEELLTALQDHYQQHGDLQMQIQQEIQELQTDHASNMEKLKELTATIGHKTAETERLFSLLTDRETELRQLTEDLDKAHKKYDEVMSQRDREKLEVDLELKTAIKEMEKTETNSNWIMEQTMACVDSCKENYAKHVVDKKEELEACKSEKLHLAIRLTKISAEKDECKIKLENEVLELEKTVTELEVKLTQEIETSASQMLVKPPGPLSRTQGKVQHPTMDLSDKFTNKEPTISVSTVGHPVGPFTEPYKKQAVKRKQTEVISSLKPKVPLSVHNQETFPQPLAVPKKPEKSLKNKFFRTRRFPNVEERKPNSLDDFDYFM